MPERPSIAWLEDPEEDDVEAAHSFLSMVIAASELDRTILPGPLLWMTAAA